MKIYFTASVTGDGKYRKQYRKIIFWLKKLRHKIISGGQIINGKLLNKDKALSGEEIFLREKKAIEESETVVAEVSQPSTGVGSEIVYALTKNKHVLALFYKDCENRLSPMIAGNPSDNLYLEHYDEDNLKIILKKFLSHVKNHRSRRGKLIVIDGADGSGKKTQADLLVNFLKKENFQVKYFDFPRYYSSFHGRMVGRFLNGEFGNLNKVSPYLASLAYALDRAAACEEMDEWLKSGGVIVANRYVTSNMAHQTARLPKEKRKEFLDWLDELEYRVHKMPREDIVIYLYVPWEIGFELTKKKGERGYLKSGKLDMAEADIKHRQEAELMYLWLSENKKNWVKVDCAADGAMRPKEEIRQEILKILKEKKIIYI